MGCFTGQQSCCYSHINEYNIKNTTSLLAVLCSSFSPLWIFIRYQIISVLISRDLSRRLDQLLLALFWIGRKINNT